MRQKQKLDAGVKSKEDNVMRNIKLESVTLHCSTAEPEKLERYFKLLQFMTKAKPVKTLAKKRIPTFKIRPGMPIGCKVTLRGKKAEELLHVLLTGVKEMHERQFNPGFLSFGVHEYIEISSFQFQREIGILGFDVVAKLTRPGYGIALRKRKKARIGKSHRITREETLEFFKNNFKLPLE